MRSDREERIRQRAYAIWQSEGHGHGREEEHWQRAEREIAAEEAGSNKAPRRAPRPKQAPAEKSAAVSPARSRSTGTETRAEKPGSAKRPASAKQPAVHGRTPAKKS
jgi:hypothetical protein